MKRRLLRIFSRLYSVFGTQRWWPADSAFEVIVGAILTQNTNWANVEKAILVLKKRRLLDPGALLSCPRRRLAQSIRSAGYYNIKSVRLKNFLRFFSDNYSADVSRMAAQESRVLRNQLLGVKGIGPETADSIMLYALGKPVFVVDTYTKRIFSRHHILEESATYAQTQDIFMRNLTPDSKMFNEYHALLVKIGKDYCRKHNPKCEVCPLHGQ